MSTAAEYLSPGISGYNIYQGATSGNPVAQTRAGLNSANLYGKLTGQGSYGGVTDALSGLNIYSGLKQGGVGGDTQAAIGAGQLGLNAGVQTGALSAATAAPYLSALGYAAVPLDIYNEARNWQSGATGQDALGGAESGAALGTAIMPGIGTAIGALGGAAAGALSSAFGSGRVDPENADFAGYSEAYNKALKQGGTGAASQVAAANSDPYLTMAGYFDLHPNQVGANNPLYSTYGRQGEQKFTDDLTSHINDAFSSGTLQEGPNGEIIQKLPNGETVYAASDAANAIDQVAVQPWINSLGTWNDPNKQALEGAIQQMTGQYVSGQAGQDWKAVGGDSPFSNIYQGSPFQGAATQAAPTAPLAAKPVQRPGTIVQAKSGGAVSDPKVHAKLKKLYEGSYANRKRHYDDGGGVDYFTPTTDTTYQFDPGLALPDYSPADLNNSLGETGLHSPDYSGNTASETSQASSALNDSSFAPGGALSGLGSLLGVSSLGQFVKQYGALAPLLTAALGGNKAASAPATPAGYGAIPSIATPSYSRPYTQPNVANWYTYGEGPEQSFFGNNQLPTVPGVSPAQAATAASPTPAAAPSGSPSMNIQPLQPQQPRAVMATGGSFDSTQGHDYVADPGHGDGTSDDIDAKLSGGEYVMDAGTVAMLGNGSNEAGARALDKLRERVRQHAGKHLVKGKQFMKAKDPAAYLKGK